MVSFRRDLGARYNGDRIQGDLYKQDEETLGDHGLLQSNGSAARRDLRPGLANAHFVNLDVRPSAQGDSSGTAHPVRSRTGEDMVPRILGCTQMIRVQPKRDRVIGVAGDPLVLGHNQES